MVETGVEPPDIDPERFGVPDELIAASVDCRAFAARKRAALQAHASQEDNLFFLRIPEALFGEVFGTEEFVRDRPAFEGGATENDLFAAVREGAGAQ
jgi:hypothetical protein